MKALRFVVLCALIVQPVFAQQSDTGSDGSARPETSIGMEAHSILDQQMSSQAMLLLRSTAGRAWIEPRAGYIFPTRDLGRTDIIENQGFGVFEDADPTAVLGLGAGVDLGSGFAIRASADWTLEASVNGEWRCAPFVACPAVLLPLDGNLSRWSVVVDAIYSFPTDSRLRPVVFAGIGVRRSDLEWGEPAADVTLPTLSFNDTDAIYRIGAGAVYSLGAAEVFGQVDTAAGRFGGRRYVSVEGSVEADRKLSVDIGFLTGVRVRLPRLRA